MSKSVKDTAEIFKALGDPTRLKILKLIAVTGNNLCVGMIVSKLNTHYTNNRKSAAGDNTPYTQNRKSAAADNISQSAVSQHLKILKSVGLVEDHKQGYFVHYKIITDSLNEFGIDMTSFLKSFGAEMNEKNYCTLKGDSDNCTRVNSTRVNSTRVNSTRVNDTREND